MLLEEHEVQKALEQAKAAFPHFGGWRYLNEKYPDYLGFAALQNLRQSDFCGGIL